MSPLEEARVARKVLFYEQEDGFADVVLAAELGWAFFAVEDLFDEFELEFWCVDFASHEISLDEGIPRSFRRGYWSQAPGFTSPVPPGQRLERLQTLHRPSRVRHQRRG